MNDVHVVPYHTTTEQTDRRQIKVPDVAQIQVTTTEQTFLMLILSLFK